MIKPIMKAAVKVRSSKNVAIVLLYGVAKVQTSAQIKVKMHVFFLPILFKAKTWFS